eukprot:COSAG01_NODE_9_length_43729_cov_66.133463_33_plen_382_part_00
MQKLNTSFISHKLKSVAFSIVIVIGILLMLNILMIFSTSAITGLKSYADSYYFIKKNTFFMIIGLAALFTGLFTPLSFFKKIIPIGLLLSFILLCLCFSHLGVSVGGAQRWLNLGFIKFQPVELAKFFLVLFFANFMATKSANIKTFKYGLLPILSLFSVFIGLLLLQPDLGNTALIMLVLLSLLFLSPIPFHQIFTLAMAGISALAISIATHPYQAARLMTFISPDLDPFGKTYHINQSLLSIGSGGLWGLGLGQSKLKFFYLPLQYSDFIFSIICEEGGFLLASFVICLFLFFLIKCTSIAIQQNNTFYTYTALGLCLFLSYQAFINIAAVIGLMPVTGIPLTYISFGGTSLITSLFYVGVILNISTQKNKKKARHDHL